ncbi:MAG: EAL domain-containing protein [Pseudomonadota bacterium]
MSDTRLIKTILTISILSLFFLALYIFFFIFPELTNVLSKNIDKTTLPITWTKMFWAMGVAYLVFFSLVIILCSRFKLSIKLLTQTESNLRHCADTIDQRIEQKTQTLIDSNIILKNEIKEHKQYEKQMLLSAGVFENTIEAIMITDRQGNILRVNKAFTTITGFTPNEIIGKNPRVFKSDRHNPAFYKQIWQSVNKNGSWEGEIWNRKKDGETFPEWLSINDIKDPNGETIYYVALFHDITELKRNEKLLKYQANYDPLTGLPNRQLFNDRLKTAITHCAREQLPMSLFFCDLDDFKNINDSLGHYAGDLLLKQVAERLIDCCRNEDTVARLGGDEFAIICPFIRTNEPAAASLARRILDAFADPFISEGKQIYAQISIGITRYPEDGKDIETLIKNADVAMYRSKGKGKNQFSFFTPELSVRVLRRISLSNDLRGALPHKEFMVYYQPKADIQTGLISGMEALMRWNRRGLEIVPPSEFIPLAEDTGAIYTLGEWIMEEACTRILEFGRICGRDLNIAVNLSVKQFSQKDLITRIKKILQKTGLPAHQLTIEITENMVIKDIDKTIITLKELNALGIQISIDDFGTGYSSLSYLKKMPLTELKIDKSFVDDAPNNTESCAIINTVLSLAENLNLKTVAEGVETQEQLNFLKQNGCNEIQGYYFCEPISDKELVAFLSQGKKI